MNMENIDDKTPTDQPSENYKLIMEELKKRFGLKGITPDKK
jgi:hypothetical protein